MKSYSLLNNNIQISVFPKTGTSFMDRLVLEQKVVIGEHQNPIIHFISIRHPIDRFISGYITLYKRSDGESTFINDSICNLNLLDAFITCFNLVKNDWSFDDHTRLSYDAIPLSSNNIKYFNYNEIGLLCESYNVIGKNYFNNRDHSVDWYLNTNSNHQKQELHKFLLSNTKIFNEVKNFLQPDIEIFQKLPIFKIKA